MNDKALNGFHDIPALELDNNQVASKRMGEVTGRELREYEVVVTAWKEKCEELGYIDFKQKKCTWVCFICLMRLFCTARLCIANIMLFAATFFHYATFSVTFMQFPAT